MESTWAWALRVAPLQVMVKSPVSSLAPCRAAMEANTLVAAAELILGGALICSRTATLMATHVRLPSKPAPELSNRPNLLLVELLELVF